MAKVLSIEVGNSITRICEVDYKVKHPRVYASFEVETPEEAYEDGYIRDPEGLGAIIKEALAGNGIHTKLTVYSIVSQKIANREAYLPYVKENKLGDLVSVSAKDYFPVDISDCKIAYRVLDQIVNEEGKKQYKVSLLSAPNELLETYFALSEAAGLSVMALDYSVNSMAQATKDAMPAGNYMLLKIDEELSSTTVFRDGVQTFQRMIPYGGDSLIDTIIDLQEAKTGEKVTYRRTLDLLRSRSCLYTEGTPEEFTADEGDDSDLHHLRMEVTDAAGMLSNSLSRVIDFYNSRNSDSPLEAILLTGYAENFVGLPEFLTNELGINVTPLCKLLEDSAYGKIKNAGDYISCIGAVVDPLDLMPEGRGDNRKKKKKKDISPVSVGKDYIPIGVVVMLMGFIIAGGLAAWALLPYNEAQNVNKRLSKRETELEPIEKVYHDYVYSTEYLNEVKTMYHVTETQNDNILQFFDDMEHALPSDVNVLSLTVDSDAISVNMNVSSKEEVANTIQAFREFKSLESVSVTDITEDFSELGTITVNFTIDAVPAPVPFDGEQAEEVQNTETIEVEEDSVEADLQ